MLKFGVGDGNYFSCSFKMQIGQVSPFLLGSTYKWYYHAQLNNLKLVLFFRRRELSVLSGSSAWLNLNYHFNIRFYFEGDLGSCWYRTVSTKQLLLIFFWENWISSGTIVKLRNKQIWTGHHWMKLFGIQTGGYRVSSSRTCIWFIAVTNPIFYWIQETENIFCSQ